MKKFFIIFTILLSTLTANAIKSVTENDVDNTLLKLDKELQNRDNYKIHRREKIKEIERLLTLHTDSVNKQISLTMQLSDAFTAFDNDSALIYISKGFDIAKNAKNDTMATYFLLKYITYLPLSGRTTRAIEIFQGIDTTGMSHNMLTAYLQAATQMSSYAASAYKDQPEMSAEWDANKKKFQKKLFNILPPNSPLRKYNEGEYYFSFGDLDKAEKLLLDVFNAEPDTSNIYARASHDLALISRARGDRNAFRYYLALSAMADVKAATLEITSLQMLGIHLFDSGDLDRAYNYLTVSLENAVECNAQMRVLETSSTLPIIEKAHTSQARKSMQRLTFALIIVALLLIIVVSLLVYLRLQIDKKTTLQGHLEGANRVKEIYLSQFINLCSIYVSKLTSFNKMVERKVTSGKTEDLAKITKSGKFVEEQIKEFYDIFDEAFLHIYPSFAESVNALLLPDKQIILQEGERLNTDLRILAFIRLGLEDSNRVAQMLNYSVNTIYAYRNRLRNRAIHRDTFEEDIMKISSI